MGESLTSTKKGPRPQKRARADEAQPVWRAALDQELEAESPLAREGQGGDGFIPVTTTAAWAGQQLQSLSLALSDRPICGRVQISNPGINLSRSSHRNRLPLMCLARPDALCQNDLDRAVVTASARYHHLSPSLLLLLLLLLIL